MTAAFISVLTLHIGILFTIFKRQSKPTLGRLLSYILLISTIISLIFGWDMISFKELYSYLSLLIFLTFLYDSILLIQRYIQFPKNRTIYSLMIGMISATVFSAVDIIQLVINLIMPIPNILISPYGLIIVYTMVGFTLVFDNHSQVIKEKHIEEKRAQMFKILSMKDRLTWAWSRAYLEKVMPALVGDICILMLDIDHFKNFNDTYGHLEGDKALIHIFNLIQREIRNSDIIIRYGGEEFLIILSDSSPKDSIEVAKRIRKAIENSHIKLDSGKDVNITVSIGICCRYVENPSREIITQMIRKADIALYRAKEAGRNRVEIECVDK